MTMGRIVGRRRIRRPGISFRSQTILIVGAAVATVATLLIASQGESISHEVLKERTAGISRVAASLEERAARAAASGGRLFQQADLQQRLPDIARQIGAEEVAIVDPRGIVVAASETARAGRAFGEPVVLETLASGVEAGREASGSSFIFVVPFHLAGGELGAFATRVDLGSLRAAVDAATSRSLLPSLLVLFTSVPAAAIVSNRILGRTYEREQQLRLEARFGSLVRNSSDLVLIVRPTGEIAYASPSIERILGHSPMAVIGMAIADLMHPDDASALDAILAEVVDAHGPAARVEWRLRRADGSVGQFEAYCTNLLADANVGGVVLNVRDVSERKELEDQLSHQAFHDPLTDLPNRALFKDRVQQALAHARRRGSDLAVLFLDLDNFKAVNDSLGHEAGDRLLLGVTVRLSDVLRASDTAARLGGDEFGVLLEDVDVDAAERAATRIKEALAEPFSLDGQEVFCGASIGIALAGRGPIDTEGLLRSADIAMYRAKQSGGGQHRVFEPAMHAAVRHRLELDADLRRAVERGELVIHYQPIVGVPGGRIEGAEALLRWSHPRRGFLAPSLMVPLAEQTGLIVPIGRFVLEAACRQAAEWDRLAGAAAPRMLSVNVSGRQLQDARFVSDVSSALTAAGIDADRLVLEITEGALVQDTEATLARLTELKELGVRLAIDDFGTGYSSLSYLRSFPIDLLKIDRSFIAPVHTGRGAFALAHAIVRLAGSLGLETVAEGVETAEQAEALAMLGCEFGQGFHFGRATSPERFRARLGEAARVA